MKKNRFIKLASGLLVLCLMTTCVIGATLAKYTTAKDTQDSARVAKWGVRISAAANSAFKTEYDKDDNSYTKGAVTVKSSSTPADKVVAPGTSGSAAQFSISGTPEVAVRLSFAMTEVKEVNLTAGTYKYTDGAEVNVPEGGYYPIKWTLKKNDTHVEGADTNVEGAVNLTLAEMATFLSTYHVDYAPNTDLSATVPTYKLYWAWAFDGNDTADSILGDLAANVSGIKKDSNDIAARDYSTQVSYTLTITATQID